MRSFWYLFVCKPLAGDPRPSYLPADSDRMIDELDDEMDTAVGALDVVTTKAKELVKKSGAKWAVVGRGGFAWSSIPHLPFNNDLP